MKQISGSRDGEYLNLKIRIFWSDAFNRDVVPEKGRVVRNLWDRLMRPFRHRSPSRLFLSENKSTLFGDDMEQEELTRH